MTAFGDTIDALSRYHAQWQSMMDGAGGDALGGGEAGLTELTFAPNPGDLHGRVHIPEALPDNAPLVVALHGCTQSAAAYQRGSFWSGLADQYGFAVLYPEQRRANNPQLCFNWFQPEDTGRGQGESASIVAMVETLVATHHLDRRRVFLTGLSAGGAMTANLLATYPDVFAAGAVIAGLPQGVATSMREALSAMMSGDPRDPAALVKSARGAFTWRGPWPRISIWHGDADNTVNPANANALIAQWTGLHGLTGKPATSLSGTARRSVWLNEHGEPLVERWSLPGFGHAAPIEAARGGEPGNFFVEAGLSSTWLAARAWGLVQDETAARPAPASVLPDIAGVIKRALRAAGL